MRKLARFTLAVLLAVASTTFGPTANATCGCNQSITYVDCALNGVGYWDYNCSSNTVSSGGQQSGAFKEVDITCPRNPDGDSDNWYQWNGSTWVLLPGPPSPTC